MIIFLPKDDVTLSEVINSLDKESFSELLHSMEQREVDIYLPKFEIKTPLIILNDYLINLGMPIAFSPDADFSEINGVKELFISNVLHKAYIDVNEEGTEAAAATAVEMIKSINGGDLRITFECNHPFLFTIYHKETNTIIFMGNIDNPL